MTSKALLSVKNLSKVFTIRHNLLNYNIGRVHAVNDVSFSICKGQTLGLVGESGCGKSTLGRMMLKLIEPTSGSIIFDGQDITNYNFSQMRSVRKKMQIIFQDPYASLNPRMTVQMILEEPIKIYHLEDNAHDRLKRIYRLLDYVQLSKDSLQRHPHEFSGGQRQRICIARALAVEPEFLVCDESIAALDVSIQAQVINLLMDLQKELNLTYCFISHDLKVIEFVSDVVAVMYLGKIVEMASAKEISKNPKHPYTKALFSAIPTVHPAHKKARIILQGDIPSPIDLPTGCYFHPRCWKMTKLCQDIFPKVTCMQHEEHQYRCHHPE